MIDFPDVHTGSLDAAGVRTLARDIEACAQRLQVVPKAAARRKVVPAAASLDEAVESLLGGDLRGLQLRYLHEGQEWWDTLMPERENARFRVVRVAHS